MARVPMRFDLLNKGVIDTLEEEGVDPIAILARFANGTLSDDPALRLSAAKELAQYVFPKKRSLDVNKEIKASISFNVVKFSEVMPEEAKQLNANFSQLRHKSALMSRPVAQRLLKDVRELDGVLVEAMRSDTERLIEDEIIDTQADDLDG